MKTTFSVLFFLRKSRVDENGHAPIMGRITINGERAQFNTKTTVNPKQWDSKSGKCIGRGQDATNTNRILESLKVRITDLYHCQLRDHGYVLPEKIKNILLGIETDKKKMLLEYFKEHNDFYSLKVGRCTSKITYKRYELTKSRVEEFLKSEYHLSDIPVIELTPVFIEKFFVYLQNEHKCCNNTALKFVQRFRSVFYYIKNTGADIKVDPFACFRFQKEKVTREVLSQKEIDILYKKRFTTDRLNQIRDVFIFACYTGLSYIDMAQLTPDSVRTAFDGHKWIMINRQKTNVPSNIRLLDIPLEIIERYSGQQKGDKLLPICSNQKMNEYLKETADI